MPVPGSTVELANEWTCTECEDSEEVCNSCDTRPEYAQFTEPCEYYCAQIGKTGLCGWCYLESYDDWDCKLCDEEGEFCSYCQGGDFEDCLTSGCMEQVAAKLCRTCYLSDLKDKAKELDKIKSLGGAPIAMVKGKRAEMLIQDTPIVFQEDLGTNKDGDQVTRTVKLDGDSLEVGINIEPPKPTVDELFEKSVMEDKSPNEVDCGYCYGTPKDDCPVHGNAKSGMFEAVTKDIRATLLNGNIGTLVSYEAMKERDMEPIGPWSDGLWQVRLGRTIVKLKPSEKKPWGMQCWQLEKRIDG